MQGVSALLSITITLIIIHINLCIADQHRQGASKTTSPLSFTTNNTGRLNCHGDEVLFWQHSLQPSHFFITPLPTIEPSSTQCIYNHRTRSHELALFVSLFTPDLLDSVRHYLVQHQDICRTEHCHVSLLPMHFIRLVHKGSRTSQPHNGYHLERPIKFLVQTSSMSLCHAIRTSIVSHCRLHDFEIQYSVSPEHIKLHFGVDHPDSVALTTSDYAQVMSQITHRTKTNLNTEEGLDRPLQHRQVQLREASDPLWHSLYWTFDQTRPDRLANILNKLIKRHGTDMDTFLYHHSQAYEDELKQSLVPRERHRLENLERSLFEWSRAESVNDDNHLLELFSISTHKNPNSVDPSNNIVSDTALPMRRAAVEKLLHYLSESVHLEGDVIKPKPIDVHLIQLDSLTSSSPLLAHSVPVSSEEEVHIVPLRCQHEQQSRASSAVLRDVPKIADMPNEHFTASHHEIVPQSTPISLLPTTNLPIHAGESENIRLRRTRAGNILATKKSGDRYAVTTTRGISNGNRTYYFKDGGTYVGSFVKGFPHGRGIRTYPNGDRYEGNWKNGRLDGNGTYFFKDGGKYVGGFVNNFRHGYGIRTYAIGDRYEGYWKDDIRNGNGSYFYKNDGVYIGSFVNGLSDGYGIRTFASGDRYEGHWKNDTPHGNGAYHVITGTKYVGSFVNNSAEGYGRIFFASGSRYEGAWKNTAPHGNGTYFFAAGGKYVGAFVNGSFEGDGIRTYSSGGQYNGTWSHGTPNGNGTYYFKDGGSYIGQFVNGSFDGYGVRTQLHGCRYEGYWKASKRHGQGKLIRTDGTVRIGVWDGDKLMD